MALVSEAEQISETSSKTESEEGGFGISGNCTDEIILKFDDGKELYASRNFLGYASPVFKAMFGGGFKESKDNYIDMKGKIYDDMHELLECLHPAILKPVDVSNALRILPLADEYQITVIMERAEDVIKAWLSELESRSSNRPTSTHLYTRSKECLSILTTGIHHKRDDFMESSLRILSKCNYKSTAGLHVTSQYDGNASEDPRQAREECERLFNELPDHVKVKVFQRRLEQCDK